MAFNDFPLDSHPLNKEITGLGVTQTAAMTLQVAAGSVTEFSTGAAHALGAAETHVFTADATYPTQVSIGLITDDGANVDVWVDSYVDDGFATHGAVPAGFRLLAGLAWFSIAANETDLINGDLNRRVWI